MLARPVMVAVAVVVEIVEQIPEVQVLLVLKV